MSIDFKLPELGENITTGDVVNVLVHEGDTIVGNQPVIELETDKAVVEIPCPHAGTVTKVHMAKGDRVNVGQTVLTVETEAAQLPLPPGEGRGEGKQAKATQAPAPSAAKTRGDGQGEKPAPREAVSRTASRASITQGTSPHPSPLPKGEGTEPRPAAQAIEHRPTTSVLPAGPEARRLGRELGVDLQRVQGSGLRGRITPEDVQAAATAAPVERSAVVVESTVPPGEPGSDSWGPVRRERISQIRRTIATRMAQSASIIPHVTNFDDADITELEQLRKGVPQGYLGPNLKLTTMPLVMKAVALSLRHHPMLNATLDTDNDQIVYKQYVNLGIAVDTPRGLVVPVVRGADELSIAELAGTLGQLAEKARAARFTVEETRGGTFTISNLGAVGGTYSTPIINYPEVAILLVGRARWLPVVRNGQIEPRFVLPLSLSYDHRLVDGAAAARFLNEVIEYLQSPGKLLLSA